MKKKLLVLAVAGAIAAPVAMADTGNVTVYGQANVAYTRVDNDTTNTNHVSSEASRIGFKGSEDLGNGTSAIWQIETGLNIDNSGTTGQGMGTRNTFAGLSGESWGSLVLGRNDSTYKSAFRGLDLFIDTVADNRSVMGLGSSTLDARNPNSATYTSPSMGGFKIAAQAMAAAETASASGQEKGTNYNLAASYNAGPITAALAWTETKFGTAGTGDAGATGIFGVDDKLKAWRLGGGYSMDAFAVNAIYERVTSDVGGTDPLKNNAWYLAGKFNISASDAVKLAYTRRGDIGDVGDTGVKQYSLGYDHALSKRTTVYALYSRINNDNGAAATFSSTGSTATAAGVTGGQDPSAIAIGMKHTF